VSQQFSMPATERRALYILEHDGVQGSLSYLAAKERLLKWDRPKITPEFYSAVRAELDRIILRVKEEAERLAQVA